MKRQKLIHHFCPRVNESVASCFVQYYLHFVEHAKDPLEFVPGKVALGLDAQTGHHFPNVIVAIRLVPVEDSPLQMFKLKLSGLIGVDDIEGSSKLFGCLGEVSSACLDKSLLKVSTENDVTEAVVEVLVLVAHLSDLLSVENLEGAAIFGNALGSDVVGLVGIKCRMLASHLTVAQGSYLPTAGRDVDLAIILHVEKVAF